MFEKYAEIYLITSPSGKQYVGKANCVDSKGHTHGTIGRWKGHLRDAKAINGGRCRLLNQEIREYDPSHFAVECILVCHVEYTWYYERLCISQWNTLYHKTNNPQGLNINEGGNSGYLSEETRSLMSQSRKAYVRNNPDSTKVSDATKAKISKSLIDNVKRRGHDDRELPKYMKYVNWKDRKGYQIISHPLCSCKYFVSSTVPIEELYNQCYKELQGLETSIKS